MVFSTQPSTTQYINSYYYAQLFFYCSEECETCKEEYYYLDTAYPGS